MLLTLQLGLLITILFQVTRCALGLPLPSTVAGYEKAGLRLEARAKGPSSRPSSSKLPASVEPDDETSSKPPSTLTCGLPLRTKSHLKACRANNAEKKSWRFDKDRLVSATILDNEPKGDCDHTLEINLVEKLIQGGALKLGVPLDSFCNRLFPPTPLGTERKQQIKRVVEQQKNLFFMPSPVNQAKKNLLAGSNSDQKSKNGKMFRAAVSHILSVHKDQLLTTADDVIRTLQSFGNLPPNLVPAGSKGQGSTPPQEQEQTTSDQVTASKDSSSVNIPTDENTWSNPFDTPHSPGPTAEKSQDDNGRTPFSFDFAAEDGVAQAWKDALAKRVRVIIATNGRLYESSGRETGLDQERTVKPTDSKCNPKRPQNFDNDDYLPSKSRKGKRGSAPSTIEAEDDCHDEQVASSSASLNGSSLNSTTSSPTTRLDTALSTASTATLSSSSQHLTGISATSPTTRPTVSSMLRHVSLTSIANTKSAVAPGNSMPLATPIVATLSTPASRIVAVPTRSSALPAQASKLSSATAPTALAGVPARAKPLASGSAPIAKPASGARVPLAVPQVQPQAPSAKRPTAALPLRGSASSKPKTLTRPLTIRRSLD